MSFSRSKLQQWKRQLGQGMTEYIIIVGVIAVSAIGVFGYFGDALREQTAGMAKEISGQDAADNIANAQDAADDAEDQAGEHYDLSNYNENGSADGGGGGG